MRVQVWRFPINPQSCQGPWLRMTMPHGARPLFVDTKDGEPCLWAEVPIPNVMEQRTLFVLGTGHEFDRSEAGPYIGSFQVREGKTTLVFHVFDSKQAN